MVKTQGLVKLEACPLPIVEPEDSNKSRERTPRQRQHLTPSMKEIKAHLMDTFGEVTVDSVMKLDREWRTKAYNVLSGLVRDQPHLFRGYKSCTSHVDKRKFLVQFLQSETAPVCDSVRSVATQDALQKRTYWKTLEQLSGAQFLGSLEHAAAFVSKAPSRLHENSALAALGVKQYQYDETILLSAITKSDQRTVGRTSTSEEVAADAERQMDEQESFDSAESTPVPKVKALAKPVLDASSKFPQDKQKTILKKKLYNCSPAVKKKLDDQVAQIAEWGSWFPSMVAKAEPSWDRVVVKPIEDHWNDLNMKAHALVQSLSDDSSTADFKVVLSKLGSELKPFTLRLHSLCKLIDFNCRRDLLSNL